MVKLKAEIKNQCCFDYLKQVDDETIDLVLIDPPYEISRKTNFKNGEPKGKDTDRFMISMDFGLWDSKFDGLSCVIDECYRVLKKGGTLVCFYDLWKISYLKSYFDNAEFKQIRFIEWIKTNPVPINSKVNYLSNAREIALVGIKCSKPTFNSKYDKGIYSFPIFHDKERFHPTQKPLGLISDIILKHSNQGDTVLDCFSGSGTTAVASILNGRNFMGCEIDSDFHSRSVTRLKKMQESFMIHT